MTSASLTEPGKHVYVADEADVVEAGPNSVDAGQAAALIDAGATLIDVRRDYEFEGGHLAGARQIEMNELAAHAEEVPRDRAVLFYCRTGNRSGMAAAAFREAGWDAHNLAGGIEGWSAGGRPLEPEDGEVLAPLPPS